ncbi:MAG: hypothetical protein H6838_14960 [Planctomycetes bacterium]|nr:hypothetical protein [Planctomycetota bacterium]
MFRPVPVVLLLASALASAHAQNEAQAQTAPLDLAAFTRLQQELTPDPAAPWRSVPWQLDLLAAQRAAAASHKPLFVWAMDGHPLGCT